MNGKIQFYKQTDEPRDSNPGSCCYGCTNASTMLQPVRLSTKIFVLVQSFLLSTYKMDTSFLVTIKCMCHSWCEMVMSDVILATFENGYVWCHHSLWEMVMSDVILVTFETGYVWYHHSLCELVMSSVVLATFENGYELYHFFGHAKIQLGSRLIGRCICSFLWP